MIGCEDEATFGLLPIIGRGWARKGSRPVVTINSKNVCINVFGARSKKALVVRQRVATINKIKYHALCLEIDVKQLGKKTMRILSREPRLELLMKQLSSRN